MLLIDSNGDIWTILQAVQLGAARDVNMNRFWSFFIANKKTKNLLFCFYLYQNTA